MHDGDPRPHRAPGGDASRRGRRTTRATTSSACCSRRRPRATRSTHEELLVAVLPADGRGHRDDHERDGQRTARSRPLHGGPRPDRRGSDAVADRGRRDPALRLAGAGSVACRDRGCGDLGTRLPAGSRMHLLFAAANRDPEVFPDPDRFDITRSPNLHLAFGFGIHHCLGASLARTEIRVGLDELPRPVPGVRGSARRRRPPALRHEPRLRAASPCSSSPERGRSQISSGPSSICSTSDARLSSPTPAAQASHVLHCHRRRAHTGAHDGADLDPEEEVGRD